MNIPSFSPSVLLAATAAAAIAADTGDSSAAALPFIPKNLARHHVGSNLFLYNATSNSYVPTDAAAAWLDDDLTTGWPIMAGKQHYLLTLTEPALLNNFCLSTRPTDGMITLYASDEPAAPGAKSWTLVARGVPLDSINDKKLAQPFSRFAKYLLIETDIADPGPVQSVYLYGSTSALSYQLRKRETPIDARAIFGQFVHDATSYNIAALYARSVVTYANSNGGFGTWQRAIDDDPESGITLMPSTDDAGLVLKLSGGHELARFAVQTGAPVKGKLDFYVLPGAPAAVTSAAPAGAEVSKVSHVAGAPVSLAGQTPTITMVLDGSTVRQSIDFPKTAGALVALRWTPETAGENITIREINAFNEISFNTYELALTPEAIAERRANGNSSGYDSGKDGKDYKDGKTLEPIGQFLPGPSPYFPGALGFPPNITRRVAPPTPLSP
jgi:hypothetical protein